MCFHSVCNMLHKAKKGRYAVGHFNFFSIETATAIINAANNQKSPVILGVSESAIRYAGLENIVSIAKNLSQQTKVPVGLHLDHGKDVKLLEKCIRKGFNSVMIDGSYLDFKKNIKLTRSVVEYAHHRHAQVEAELGQLKGIEDNAKSDQHVFTDPEAAKEFVEKTDVDSLAIAIGTSHGAYKFSGPSRLRYDLLADIRKKVSVPLVLHGASGVPKNLVTLAEKYGARFGNAAGVSDPSLKKAIKAGIQKVNTDTDIRIAYTAAVREFLHDNPKEFDPRKINAPAIRLMTQVVENRMKVLGSCGKAR